MLKCYSLSGPSRTSIVITNPPHHSGRCGMLTKHLLEKKKPSVKQLQPPHRGSTQLSSPFIPLLGECSPGGKSMAGNPRTLPLSPTLAISSRLGLGVAELKSNESVIGSLSWDAAATLQSLKNIS